MYSNKVERANQDIYDDIKLKKNLCSLYFSALINFNMIIMFLRNRAVELAYADSVLGVVVQLLCDLRAVYHAFAV